MTSGAVVQWQPYYLPAVVRIVPKVSTHLYTPEVRNESIYRRLISIGLHLVNTTKLPVNAHMLALHGLLSN